MTGFWNFVKSSDDFIFDFYLSLDNFQRFSLQLLYKEFFVICPDFSKSLKIPIIVFFLPFHPPKSNSSLFLFHQITSSPQKSFSLKKLIQHLLLHFSIRLSCDFKRILRQGVIKHFAEEMEENLGGTYCRKSLRKKRRISYF